MVWGVSGQEGCLVQGGVWSGGCVSGPGGVWSKGVSGQGMCVWSGGCLVLGCVSAPRGGVSAPGRMSGPGGCLVPGGMSGPGGCLVLGDAWSRGDVWSLGGMAAMEGHVCSGGAWHVCSGRGGVVSLHALRQTPPHP